jgi:hypothetical protein
MVNTSKLAPWEVQALVSHLMYRLSQEDRLRFMVELPEIYNKIHGRDIVVCTILTDGKDDE